MKNEAAGPASLLQLQSGVIYDLGDAPSMSDSFVEDVGTPASGSPPHSLACSGSKASDSPPASDSNSNNHDAVARLCVSPTSLSPLRSGKRKAGAEGLGPLSCKRVKVEECESSPQHARRTVVVGSKKGSRQHQISIRALLLPEDSAPPRQRQVQVVLSRLPADAIRLILQQCTGQSLLSLACVCRRFNQEVCSNEQLWRARCANEFPIALLGHSSVDALRWKEDDELVSWHTVYKCYSGILANHLISCTGMDPAKKIQQRDLIVAMGGGYQGHLDRKVTVLVVGQTGTDKYKFAKNEGIALVTGEWVEECFKQRRLLDITDFQPHIFLGLKFCVTQVQAGVRSYIEEQASTKGGEYTADLRKAHNTHLIAVRADGRKFQYAHHWGMKVVTPSWFFECLSRNEYVDEHPYWIPFIPALSL